jgi:hypothetical protein
VTASDCFIDREENRLHILAPAIGYPVVGTVCRVLAAFQWIAITLSTCGTKHKTAASETERPE